MLTMKNCHGDNVNGLPVAVRTDEQRRRSEDRHQHTDKMCDSASGIPSGGDAVVSG